jgi:hypothetical protein
MRRREKFVIAAILLSLGLLGVQYVSLEWRYWAVGAFALVTYFISAWALSNDLQRHEWLTILPMPAWYAGAVALFYFLLPTNLGSRIFILGLFGVGMYALYLSANIYSVAKGRTIQLVHAAHAIAMFFTLVTSLLFLNSIFSLRLAIGWNTLLVGMTHAPLVLLFLWSINLEEKITRDVWLLTGVVTLMLMEAALILSLYPFSVWHISLFIMSGMYILLGVAQSHLKSRLFSNTLTEYSLVAFFVGLVFIVLFPGK